jgi:hypothetical protein
MLLKYDQKGEIKEVYLGISSEFIPYVEGNETLLEVDEIYVDIDDGYVENSILKSKGTPPKIYSDWDWVSKSWEDNLDKAAEYQRTVRNSLLADADILIFKAEDLGQDTTALRQYRQELRDITKQEGFPLQIIYPQIPV